MTAVAATALLVLLAKATLVLVAALGVARGLQRAAAGARYLVWLVTLGGLLLVPTLAAWSPLRVAVLPPSRVAAPAPGSSTSLGAPTAPAPPVAGGSRRTASAASGPVEPGRRPIRVATGVATWVATGIDQVAGQPLALLGALWGMVALAVAGSLLRAWLVVRRIVRHARPLDGAGWRDPLWEVADRLGLDEPPRLLRSAETMMPFACGLRWPTIVLPAASDAWTPERRRAVLLHELAHVRRRDLAGHTLARVVCAVYWFHPLVWTAARRLRAESERACDDLALTCGARAADYAEHLLDIVTSVRGDATPSAALALARRTEFEGRLLDILDGDRPRAAPSRRQAASLVGALAVLTVTVGAVAPVPVATPAATPAAVPASGARAALRVAAAAPSSIPSPAPRMPAAVSAPTSVSHAVGIALGTEVLSKVLGDVEGAAAVVGRDVAATVTPSGTFTAGVFSPEAPAARADDRAELLARVLRTDTSTSLRRVAAWGLAQHVGTPVAAAALAAALRGDRVAAVREMAAWSLAEAEREPAVRDALAAALRGDADAEVRGTAAWALGTVGDRSATEALVAALGDANAEVRIRAVWALGSVGPREAPRALVGMLGDGDPRVRKLAAWALYTLADPAAVPALQSALRAERDPELQVAYVRALAAMGERSVDALRGLLESSDPRVKAVAVRALAGGTATGPWPWPWPRPRPFP